MRNKEINQEELTCAGARERVSLETPLVPKDKYSGLETSLETGIGPISRKLSLAEKRTLIEIEKDVLVGSQAIQQYRNSSWWAWEAGSGLLFWRWPTKQSRIAARDGFPVYVSGILQGTRESKGT